MLLICVVLFLFFKQKTAYEMRISDWSSDVCSSDLFLLTPFLQKAGADVVGRMRARVVDELTTTFKSHYSHEISLTDALSLETIANYNAKRTGEKYLIRP